MDYKYMKASNCILALNFKTLISNVEYFSNL